MALPQVEMPSLRLLCAERRARNQGKASVKTAGLVFLGVSYAEAPTWLSQFTNKRPLVLQGGKKGKTDKGPQYIVLFTRYLNSYIHSLNIY